MTELYPIDALNVLCYRTTDTRICSCEQCDNATIATMPQHDNTNLEWCPPQRDPKLPVSHAAGTQRPRIARWKPTKKNSPIPTTRSLCTAYKRLL